MRAPTAWAISPPTFASISSKTSNGTASCAASADLIASINREISPLEAIARTGFSVAPLDFSHSLGRPLAKIDNFRNCGSVFSFQRLKERDPLLEGGQLLGIEIELLGIAAEIARNLR